MHTSALRKTFSLELPVRFQALGVGFVRQSRQSWVTPLLIIVCALGVAAYLASLYRVTDLSFRIERERRALERLESAVLETELKVSEVQTKLAKSQPILLGAMEKISAIKYLTPESFAASLPELQP